MRLILLYVLESMLSALPQKSIGSRLMPLNRDEIVPGVLGATSRSSCRHEALAALFVNLFFFSFGLLAAFACVRFWIAVTSLTVDSPMSEVEVDRRQKRGKENRFFRGGCCRLAFVCHGSKLTRGNVIICCSKLL